MKKSLLALICISIVAAQALLTAAYVSPYAGSQISSRYGMRTPAELRAEGCNMNIEASPGDVHFVGLARRECVEKNKYHIACQQRCFDQVSLMARGSSLGKPVGAYSRYGCQEIDAMLLAGVPASSCAFMASNECAKANSGNDYCRRKCVQKSYAVCRQNIMSSRRTY